MFFKGHNDFSDKHPLLMNLPIYVTNKNNDGMIASYSMPLGQILLLMMIGYLNALGWGIYGLVQLVDTVI